jgi:phage terminase large subunit-like protein
MPLRTSLRHRYNARLAAKNPTFDVSSENALRARNDFAYFCEYVTGRAPAAHHHQWIKALVTNQDSACLKKIAGWNLEILAPRGSAKSTIVALLIAWVIGHNPNTPIIYVSYSESVALSRSRIIKRIIEGDRYREIFPNILPGKRWADTDWEIDKQHAKVTDLDYDYTFYATGILGSITSRRSGLILYDDMIKSSDQIANPEQREKIIQNIAEVLRPTLIPGGREIDIGTRFRPDDVHATEFTSERGWEVITQSAIIEDSQGQEHSYWPERFPLEELQWMREDKPAVFSFQYQNVIIRLTDTSIDPNWIIKGQVPAKFDQIVVGADLSSTQNEKSDYTVFILGGKVWGDDKYYVIDVRRGRWTGNISKLNVLLDMLVEWGLIDKEEGDPDLNESHRYYSGDRTVYFAAESVAYQSSLQGDFKEYVIGKHRVENIVYRKPKVQGDKLSRLRGVSGLFENELVVFNQEVQFGRVIKELTNFGSMDHEDCADAMVYMLRTLASRRALEVA